VGGVSGEVALLTQFRFRSGRYAPMPAERRARSSRKFRSRGAATAVGVGVVFALAPVVHAGAIGLPTSFAMSPSSGPPGTTVQVSGNGCSPGLLGGSSSVMIDAGTMPPTSVQVPAKSNGAWRGTFKIPGAARATAAEVTATCVSGGLQSLLTIYWPKTFTVSGGVVPTTPSSPVSTPPRTSTTATLSGPDIATTTSPASVPNVGAGSGATGASTDTGAGAASGNGSSGHEGAPRASGTASGATTSGPLARAADLRSPELSVSKSNDGAGLGWLLWLLVLSVPVGALALYAWMRHARRAGVAGLESDST